MRSYSRRMFALGLSMPLAVASAVEASGGQVVDADTAWCAAAEVSRWSQGTGLYHLTTVYGRGDAEWLRGATGLAAGPGGGIAVFDGANSEIHVLGDDLAPTVRFGRRGGGPAELSPMMPVADYLRYPLRNLVAMDDTAVFVHDGRSLKHFRPDGRFVRVLARLTGLAASTAIGGVRFITIDGDRLLVAENTLVHDGGANLRRVMRTLSVTSSHVEVVDSLKLPSPASRGVGPQEAHALWAARNGCVVVGDGNSHLLFRRTLATGAVDTLRLPDHDVRVASREVPEPLRERLGRTRQHPPGVLWRWTELIIDPDGHIWANGWTERDEAPAIYRSGPDGAFRPEAVPAFPRAFGSPGVFYATMRDPDTGEVLVARYERRP